MIAMIGGPEPDLAKKGFFSKNLNRIGLDRGSALQTPFFCKLRNKKSILLP